MWFGAGRPLRDPRFGLRPGRLPAASRGERPSENDIHRLRHAEGNHLPDGRLGGSSRARGDDRTRDQGSRHRQPAPGDVRRLRQHLLPGPVGGFGSCSRAPGHRPGISGASELLLDPGATYVDGKSMLVAISRSGATSETARVVGDFKARRLGKVVVLTNALDSPIAADGDIVLAMAEGREESVAQTRSFASMHVAATAMADLLGPDAMGDAYKKP